MGASQWPLGELLKTSSSGVAPCLPASGKPQISYPESLHTWNTQSGFCFLDRFLTDTKVMCVNSVNICLPPKP